MNKLFTKAAKILVGLSLAAGVGVAVGSQKTRRADASAGTAASGNWTPITATSDINTSDDFLLVYETSGGTKSYATGSVSSSALQSSGTLENGKTVQFESATGGYYIKLGSSSYLNNSSGTGVSSGNKSSIWSIALDRISNTSNSNRFLGALSDDVGVGIKAYATSNLNGYQHVVVYKKAAADNRQDSSVSITNGASADVSVGGSLTLSTSTTPNDAVLTFTSSDESIATVSAAGVVSGVAVGSTTVIASFAGDTTYKPSSAHITINVAYSQPAHVTGMTVAQILALGTENIQAKAVIYEVEAYVTQVTDKVYTYGNFYVNDTKGNTTNQVYVYGATEDSTKLTFNTSTGLYAFSSNASNASSLENKMSVGSKITANFIAYYFSNALQFQGIITSVVNETMHTVTTSVSNGTYTGATQIGEGSATVTISANTGYKLPTTVTVSGADHTFDRTTGIITLSNATGNVTISATCVAATQYDVTITATNCTYSPASPKIYEESELEITFTANSGYKLPLSAPVVTNATVKSWENGVLTLQNPTGNVSFTMTAQVKTVDKYGLYTGDIAAGKYVIVGADTSYALKNTISSNRFDNGTVTITQGVIQEPDDAIVWTISKVSGTNYWSLYNEKLNKYAGGTSTKNQGAMLESITDLAKWTITYNDGYVFHNYGRSQASSDSANAYLRQNGTSGWATYASSTANAPTLYKLDYLPKAFDYFEYVDGTPDKTTYSVGDPFDPTGLEIHAVYTEPSIYPAEDITDEIEWDALTVGSTATGTWNGETVTITGLTITAFTPALFTKVTALDQLAVGSEVIFGGYKTSTETYYSLCAVSGNGKFFTAESTTSGTNGIYTLSSTLIFTVEADRSGYYFKNGNNYISRNASDSAFTTKSENSCWTLSFGENGALKMTNGDSGNKDFQFNQGDPRFKNYSGQSDCFIFIREAASQTDVLKTFVSRYLLLNNETLSQIPSSSTGVVGTDCLGANGPYMTAKAALTTGEFVSYNSAFQSSTDSVVSNARLRYVSWADAYGDSTPYATTVGNGARVFGGIINDSNNTVAIIIVISMVSVTAIGGYFFLKKRREQN